MGMSLYPLGPHHGGHEHPFAVQDSQGMPLAQQEWAADPLFAPVSLAASLRKGCQEVPAFKLMGNLQ